jgi:hypothetical protein
VNRDASALPPLAHRLLQLLVVVGAVASVGGLYLAPQRTWANALMSSYFMVELSLAALFFLAAHDVAGARWHLAFRPVPEAMARVLPLGAAGVLLVLVIHPELYPWFTAPPPEGGVSAFKHAWLSRPFFLLRSSIYLLCWIGFARAFAHRWAREERDPAASPREVPLSAGFLVVFALTLVAAAFDWIMSLQPEWYSSIFGFYEFASMFVGGIAAIVLLVIAARRFIPASVSLTEAHVHDLGKLLFAFSSFWAYIWFSQYMLIWYGNIPEETSYYVIRQHGRWAVLFVLNVILSWTLPFVLLLSQRAKKTERRLLVVAAIVLIGRLLDLYLQVLPGFMGPQPLMGLSEIGPTAIAIGLFTLAFFRMLRRAPSIPLGQRAALK